jgi:hypothetical protein
MISTYAPSSENDTTSYINAVAGATGINPDADMYDIVNGEKVKDVVKAMSIHEQGNKWYADNFNQSFINSGYDLA